MRRVIQPATASGAQRQVRLYGYPDQCPRCHSKLVPKPLASVATGPEPRDAIEEAFQCTNEKCQGIFCSIYDWRPETNGPPSYDFSKSIPLEPVKPTIGPSVTSLSSGFLNTYSQALIAESLGLDQLTGIGLRKALEFLVKDFAISRNEREKDAILKKPLSRCIDDHIDQAQVQQVAKRATWLGNDETHYVRKWEDKDISDLKVLITLTINGIENVLLAEKYVSEMPDS